MITDADIKKLERVFATKRELANTAISFKKDIVDFKDSILSEIIKLREDIEVVIGYRDLIEGHDKRIEKLETTVYQ